MKNLITMLALAIVAGAACSTATAKDKKDKKAATTEQAMPGAINLSAPVTLSSRGDSISYAAGVCYTQGMLQYVQQQLAVDTTYKAKFIEGLQHGLSMPDTPEAQAKAAGVHIAAMVRGRMAPQLQEQLQGGTAELNKELFYRAFIDAVQGDASVLSTQEAQPYFQQQMTAEQKRKEEALKAVGKLFLEENAKKPGVKTTASGLQYKVLVEGNGPVADKDQEVVVKYEGKLVDGTIFDSSYQRNPQTTTFKPTQVIKGWTEALTMMPQGSTWELYIPEDLGYGGRDMGKIPAYSTLIFKVEMVEVKPKPAATTTPATTTKATTGKKK